MEPLLMLAVSLTFLFSSLETASAGSIVGKVKFSASPPTLEAIKVSKDQDYCGEMLPNEIYIVDADKGLKNAVVFIEAAPAGKTADPEKLNIVENNGCLYAPRILAMQKGERLRVRNNDPKLHIPHSYLKERTVFMLSLPFRSTALDATRKIRDPGILKLVCDTHSWMTGFVHVFDHPYFSVTNEQGEFSIPNLPAGSYTLKVWHEGGGIRSQEITVLENGEVQAGFDFGGK